MHLSLMFRNLAIVLVLVFGGCSSHPLHSSGFLGDARVYRAMQHNPDFGVHELIYQPGAISRYDTFTIPPVKIYLNREGLSRDLKMSDLRGLTVVFRKRIIAELKKGGYKISHVPGKRTATLRIAITDANPSVAVLNAVPQVNFVTAAGIGGASFEAEMLDSWTDRPIAAAMDARYGKRYKYLSGFSKWGHTEDVFGEWARNLRKRLDEARRLN